MGTGTPVFQLAGQIRCDTGCLLKAGHHVANAMVTVVFGRESLDPTELTGPGMFGVSQIQQITS